MIIMYIDEVFILNGIINFVILLITKKLIRSKTKNYMLISGALISALYAVLMVVPQLWMLYTLIGKIIFSFVLVWFVYQIKSVKAYIEAAIIFYIVSFSFGGAGYALISILRVRNKLLPVSVLAASTTLAYILILLFSRYQRRKMQKERQLVKLSVCTEKGEKHVECLVDTGNSLYEPISHVPVIVVELAQIIELLPAEICDLFDKEHKLEISKIVTPNVRIIPFRSLGQDKGWILGFKPDLVKITYENKNIETKKVILGIYEGKLSCDDTYSSLLNPEILEAI